MREWNLKPVNPIRLTLAADARFGPVQYCDDQVWELSLGEGVPPALAVQTSFGLRARSFRMFPRFSEGETVVSDPAAFHRFPVIRQFYTNYLRMEYTPFPGIDVEAEYWVPQSEAISGRLRLANTTSETRMVRLEWIAQLTPTEGQRMAPLETLAAPALAGRTANLAPVVFLTGGPVADSAPFPALALNLEIAPNSSRRFTWGHAALEDAEQSFNLARQMAARPWEAEIARLVLTNESLVDIHTGNLDWDLAFALSQKTAIGLFTGPSRHLPCPSYVVTRQPDQGYSLRGDGSDYNHLWNGQAPLEAVYLASLILPAAPQLVEGLVRNFLAAASADGGSPGQVDCKPGLGGQRSRLMAAPMLATLAWQTYLTTQDKAFLKEVFSPLLEFVQAWFSPDHDRDGDGVPEWDSLIQTGWEDHPLFSRWHLWSQGIDISAVETPGLCSRLYRECKALIEMAGVLERQEPVAALQSLADHLHTAVEASWEEASASYLYWDRDTHRSTPGELLARASGPGEIHIQRAFEDPIRLLVRIQTNNDATRHPEVIVRGASASGQHRIERISEERFKWYLGQASLTGERVYRSLEEVDIQGVQPDDETTIYSVGYACQDQSLLLPIWAGIPDESRADALVNRTITNPDLYWAPFGLPACPAPAGSPEAEVCSSVHLPWNNLIGEGLLQYGRQAEAGDLVSRIMAAVVKSLKQDGSFRRNYDANTGLPRGERDALNGLAPVGLFLKTLGVHLFSASQQVEIRGTNPFPWPVTVKYRGMTILRGREKTTVIFPDGQEITIDDPAPQVVSLE